MTQPTFTWIQPITGAKTSAPFDATDAGSIVVSADVLVAAEHVDLYVIAGSTNVVVSTLDGTPVKLTATVPAVCLEGGARYVVVKSVTASACGVYVVSKST
jgi:hypothetical protein